MSTTNCSSSDLNTGVAMFSGDNPLELPAPTAFHTAINYSSSQSVHQANARAIVIGSDIYYSPNCSLTPPLPTFPTGAQPVTYFETHFKALRRNFIILNGGASSLAISPSCPHLQISIVRHFTSSSVIRSELDLVRNAACE